MKATTKTQFLLKFNERIRARKSKLPSSSLRILNDLEREYPDIYSATRNPIPRGSLSEGVEQLVSEFRITYKEMRISYNSMEYLFDFLDAPSDGEYIRLAKVFLRAYIKGTPHLVALFRVLPFESKLIVNGLIPNKLKMDNDSYKYSKTRRGIAYYAFYKETEDL